MRKCQMCPSWFEPRALTLKVCIRCEAYLDNLSLRLESGFGPQLPFRFPLFPQRRRRRTPRRAVA